MFELGVRLKEARLRRSLELEQVEEQTRISRRYLRALEDERFELLPGDAYAKAFLRSYADFLGLDAKLYVDEYTGRFDPRAPEPTPASSPPRRHWPRPLRAVRPWPLVVAAAAVAVLAVLAWQFGGSSSQPISHPNPVRPATRSASPNARPTPRPKPQPVPVLSLKAARGRCWIDAHLDSPTGKVVYVGTLAQGTTIRFSLHQPLWIRLGAPSTLDARIGGKPVTDLPTQTASLIVTKTGIRAG
jgi:transcriptional regulator with XRE-family HTH domain